MNRLVDINEEKIMDKETAIEILEEVKVLDDSMYQYNPTYMEALDMAIEALKNRIESKTEN
jgi:hypothetical protein